MLAAAAISLGDRECSQIEADGQLMLRVEIITKARDLTGCDKRADGPLR
jgi:hypothetical protein